MKTKFPLPILFENKNVFVFDKPARLAVQGGNGVKVSVDSLLKNYFNERPLLVHRLDKDTSGALLVAKNKKSAALYSKLFFEHKIEKEYTAICKSNTDIKKQGKIDIPLNNDGKEINALTFYKTLFSSNFSFLSGGAIDENYAVLKLEIQTGRMHQIRRHLFSIGCPILGDVKYGDFALNKKLERALGLKNLLLHCNKIMLNEDGRMIAVHSPLPEYFLPFTRPTSGL